MLVFLKARSLRLLTSKPSTTPPPIFVAAALGVGLAETAFKSKLRVKFSTPCAERRRCEAHF